MTALATESRTPILVVEEASKAYGSRTALNGVSFTVNAGEFVALLGPNGAGKTTLFQLLSGLYGADGGTIAVGGHDIRHHPVPALASLGIVFQQPTLDLDISVAGNLRFHARLHGMPRQRARRRIHEEMARLELSERANDLVRGLSGGNRRRVELARALLHEPALLLMDEPTVGLDPASRRQLTEYVLTLRRARGVGVLWATHLVDEAELADRVIVLHQGQVVREGSPSGLVAETGMTNLADAFLSLTGNPKQRG